MSRIPGRKPLRIPAGGERRSTFLFLGPLLLCLSFGTAAAAQSQETVPCGPPFTACAAGPTCGPSAPAQRAKKPAAAVTSQPKSPPSYKPLTGKEKFDYYVRSLYNPSFLLRATAGAGLSQAVDHVPEWGQGMEGYGKRLGSRSARYAIKRSLKDGIGALMGYDPRYQPAGRRGFWARTGHAVAQAFVSKKDDGGNAIAYPHFAAAFGAAFISISWYPDRYQTIGGRFAAGGIIFGYDAAANVFKEYWPDIKKRVGLGH